MRARVWVKKDGSIAITKYPPEATEETITHAHEVLSLRPDFLGATFVDTLDYEDPIDRSDRKEWRLKAG